MEIYEIKVLDCSFERNRKRLVNAVKKVLHIKSFPKRAYLEKYIEGMADKGIKVSKIKQMRDGSIFVSIEVARGTYSTFLATYYYEALCKFILIGDQHIRYNRRLGK